VKNMVVILLVLNACSGSIAEVRHVDACSDTSDPTACENCIAHAPRGEAGYAVCQTEGAGECCATTQADGSCVATFTGGTTVEEECGPVQ
jgi:hypothetical protein